MGTRRRRGRLTAVLLAVTLTASGCGSSNPLGGGTVSGDLKSVVVGSADFPESKIVAEIYAHALEVNGFTVGRQFGIGSRETYIPALRDHSIDLVPEYIGNLLQYFDPKSTVTEPDQVELALQGAAVAKGLATTLAPQLQLQQVAPVGHGPETAEGLAMAVGVAFLHIASIDFGQSGRATL
jgi:osmoprotectant transport system substrate-binding protein